MSSDIIYPTVSMTQLPINPNTNTNINININLIINDDINNNNNINENIMNNDITNDITNDIMNSINQIKYSIDDFYTVKNMIREELGNINFFSLETQELLEQMFQSVPIVNRKKKIIQDEEWRKKKPLNFNLKKENQDDSEKIYQELKGYLNRISVDNYLSILDEINKLLDIFQEDKDKYITQLLNDIFKKARLEPTYCIYYVKIILGLNHKSNIQEFINQLKISFRETIITLKPIIVIIEKNESNSDNDSNETDNEDVENKENLKKKTSTEEMESYDDFCKSKKNKNYQKGFSQFVGELFNFQQLTIHEIIYFLNNMLENIVFIAKKLKDENDLLFDDVKKSYHKMIEENILYLAPLIEITIENIKTQIQNNSNLNLNEKVNNIFRIIEELSQNKIIINKNRFLLTDLFDIYQKQLIVKPKKEFRNNNNINNTNTTNNTNNINNTNNTNNNTQNKGSHNKSFNTNTNSGNNTNNGNSYRKGTNFNNSQKGKF